MSSHRKRPAASRSRSHSPSPKHHRRPSFPSFVDSPDLPPKIRLLCQLISKTPPELLPSTLSSSSLLPSPSDVESVLKLSYSHPLSALSFFRWSLSRLPSLSPYSWNLAVDLLGKNRLFDPMWQIIHSMLPLRLLSLATLASVFSSFASARLPDEALSAFQSMPSLFSLPLDPPALNSLLSAFCRESQTPSAAHFLSLLRHRVRPDPDSFAILLEGWENESDPRSARKTFDDMIDRFGWDPANVPAYDSFLCTLLKSSLSDALKFLASMTDRHCYPSMKFFRVALDEFVKLDDARGAVSLWKSLVGKNGCYPDTEMYNSMIRLQGRDGQTDLALRLLDEMVAYGAFPDEKTYDLLFKYLIKGKKLREAVTVFREMVKNEFVPSDLNCEPALRAFLDSGEFETAVEVWRCMAENKYSGMEESGNMLVGRLRDAEMLPERCKLAEDMIERGVKLNSATLSKLRASLLRLGKGNIYDGILRKWKGIKT